MTDEREDDREASVVLAEAVGYLALTATRRLYEEQPDLWKLGEHGRARTLEDFTHHLRMLAGLSPPVVATHVAYCEGLWKARGFPRRWLDDAWRILDEVLRDELPQRVHEPARELLRTAMTPAG